MRWGTRRASAALLLGLSACCPDAPADLEDPDPAVRREALACQAADPDDPEHLIRVAILRLSPHTEPDPSVRASAARALLYLGARSAGPALAASLSGGSAADPHPLVRLQAAASLRRLEGAGAVEALRAGLGDPDRDVRLAAARELGRAGERSAATTEVLVQALHDQAPEVRFHARRALASLHGVDLGLLPESWENWERQRQAALRAGPETAPVDEPDEDRPGEDLPDEGDER